MHETLARPPASHLDLLERPLFAHFATVAADGSPRVNVMWFLWDADVENVEADPTGAFYQRLQQRNRGETSEVEDRDVRVVLTIRPTGFKAR